MAVSIPGTAAAHDIEFGTPHYSGYCDIGAEYQADGLYRLGFNIARGSTSNRMIGPAGAGPVTLSKPQYLKASSPSTWIYTEDSPIYPQWNGMRSYYNTGQSQAGTGESLSCSTDSHQ
jgi:hypothetical protein